MVRRGSPPAFQQFHRPELFKRDAAPVGRRTNRLQTALAFSAVLIAQHSKLPLAIPPQPVWAHESTAVVVHGGDGSSALDRRPNQPVYVFHGLDLRLDNTHPVSTISTLRRY